MSGEHDPPRSPSHLRRTWSRFRRDPVAMAALIFLVIVALAGIFHGWIEPYDPHKIPVGDPLQTPSGDYLLGTDNLGRDIFSRLLEGAWVSMRFSLLAVGGALLIAVPLGMLSGYLGGVVDAVLMRISDAIMSIPGLVLAIALVAVLGRSLTSAMIAIGVAMVPGFTRLVRGQALAVREETFVEASNSIGTSTGRIIRRHIFPNILSPLVVQASIVFGVVLLAEASLSFLGLGAQPPTASWGVMLEEANDFLLTDDWWQAVPPGLAIALSVLAFNLVGDGLRSALGVTNPVRRYGRLGLTTVARGDQTSTVARGDHASTVARGDHADTVARGDQAPGVSTPTPDSTGPAPLLVVKNLQVDFDNSGRSVRIVDGVSFSVAPGETLGLVGESGSGKTVTSLSIMRLLPSPPATISGGSVHFDGHDLLGLPFKDMRRLRGKSMAMIFQDPMASLNPSLTIAHQIGQVVRWHEGASRREAHRWAGEMLERVGVSAKRADSYPHELSGGMRQRAMIAMALACQPKLLIADEPTTALDVTIQAQVLELLRELQADFGMAMIFVTHDLGVVADICDRVAVMYAGEIVETAPVGEFFRTPVTPMPRVCSGRCPSEPNAAPSSTPSPGRCLSSTSSVRGAAWPAAARTSPIPAGRIASRWSTSAPITSRARLRTHELQLAST